jgi:hypothetical protein
MKHAQVCHEHLEAWVRAGNAPPRYVIHSRPDVRWFADLPQVSTVPPGHVGLRGCTVVWQKGDAPFSSDQLAGGDCHVYLDRCAAAIKLVQHTPGVKCVNVDDQFAIMPFGLAPTFFSRRPPLARLRRLELDDQRVPEAMRPRLPRGRPHGQPRRVYLTPLRFVIAGPGTRGHARQIRNTTPVDCSNFTN